MNAVPIVQVERSASDKSKPLSSKVILIALCLGSICLAVIPERVFAQTTELTYDDGSSERMWWKTESGVGECMAVRFSSPYNLTYIVSVKYYISEYPETFNVLILDSYRKYVYERPVTPIEEGWFTVDLSDEDILVKVAMKWTKAEKPRLGTDESRSSYGRSFFGDGTWTTYKEERKKQIPNEDIDGTFMIRAIIAKGGTPHANFSCSPTEVIAGGKVSFIDLSSGTVTS